MTSLLANAGVPMLFPQLVLMSFALLPIVLIEAAVIGKAMGISVRSAFLDVGLANVCTTILGVPCAWAVMLGLHLLTTGGYALGIDTPAKMLAAVTLQAAWLVPYEGQLFWMIPAAATVLLFPCFLVSVLIERWVLVWRRPDLERRAVLSAVLRANVWSYLLLFVAGGLWLIRSAR